MSVYHFLSYINGFLLYFSQEGGSREKVTCYAEKRQTFFGTPITLRLITRRTALNIFLDTRHNYFCFQVSINQPFWFYYP